MNTPLIYYITSLGVGLAVIAVAAGILRKHGRAALLQAYRGQTAIAGTIMPFLVAGFCLLNTGCLLFLLNTEGVPATDAQALQYFGTRTGCVLLGVAFTLYANLMYINQTRRDQLYAPMPTVVQP